MTKVFLNKISPFREIDYFQLKSALSNYANLHAKIRQLLATGALIRVKKGLYVLVDDYNDTAISADPTSLTLWSSTFFSELVEKAVF